MSILRSELPIGTCSWKYPEWKGLVYNSDEQYLAQYCRHFSTVEIDQWFWSLSPKAVRLPDRNTAAEYSSQVDDEFRFTIKLPDSLSLSHYRKTAGSSELKINPHFLQPELFRDVLEELSPILPKTSVLMLQFEYLNKQKMPDRADLMTLIADLVSSAPESPALGVELRNPAWLDGDWFRFLGDIGASPVLLHGYYMDSVWTTIDRHIDSISTQRPIVLRLHGPDRSGMDELSGGTWNRIVRPMDSDIANIVERVHLLQRRGIETIINVNNHFEGSAPLSIKSILEIL